MKNILFLSFLIILISCSSKNPLEKALSSNHRKIKAVVDNLEEHEVQILFTQVVEKNDSIVFQDYSFQVNSNNYFYPASTVKFPIAILALEKLARNPSLNRDTSFVIDTLRTTFSNEIIKLFAVSDNLAYTRLFEYLGKDYINDELNSRGIEARISHRFSVEDPYNLKTKPLYFYKEDRIVFSSEITINKPIEKLTMNRLYKGIGYLQSGSLVNEPKDFSLSNFFPLNAQHDLMKRLIFPELYPKELQFNLSKSDRDFLIKAMNYLPKEVGYDSIKYYDSYVKFLVFGDSKKEIPSHIKIYNKVGLAYGYLTDCAYIVNEKTNKKYILTATILVNKNQIYNDGIYEYDEIGFPFLAELGRQLVL